MFSVNKYVITDDRFLQPRFSISPFETKYINLNRNLADSDIIDEYFNKRFEGKNYVYTSSGRSAINQALSLLNLERSDIITIFTTSGNYYISGCVTHEIEKYCRWSRKIEPKTKALFVNHEFGFPYENLSALLKFELPIIEDCAHSFISQNREKTVGNIGDYVIFSLPKFFPVQFGGLLVSKENKNIKSDVNDQEERYIKNVLSANIINIEKIKLKRIKNYYYLEQKLNQIGFMPRFDLCENSHFPGVYLFKTGTDINLDNLKTFMQTHGVECSVFYNEQAFFLPVHQNLDFDDLDYFVTLIKYFQIVILGNTKDCVMGQKL